MLTQKVIDEYKNIIINAFPNNAFLFKEEVVDKNKKWSALHITIDDKIGYLQLLEHDTWDESVSVEEKMVNCVNVQLQTFEHQFNKIKEEDPTKELVFWGFGGEEIRTKDV